MKWRRAPGQPSPAWHAAKEAPALKLRWLPGARAGLRCAVLRCACGAQAEWASGPALRNPCVPRIVFPLCPNDASLECACTAFHAGPTAEQSSG